MDPIYSFPDLVMQRKCHADYPKGKRLQNVVRNPEHKRGEEKYEDNK